MSAGRVFKSLMKPLAKGALGTLGGYGANQVIEGGKTAQASSAPQIFIFMQYVRMPNGAVYKVCQQVQNGNYSYPYYC
ncbi:MAG: hypothetical protein HC778_00295 [Chamaesiphon sp. CSU_1_12]|nr:hypothetical protein [Chamaesiphon sp. CSU_1_12]